MKTVKVRDVMTPSPVLISPDSTLQQAAEMMAFINCGMLPVGTRQEVEGVITDRDMITRAVAKGANPSEAKVADYMTTRVCSCNEDDFLEDAAEKLRKFKVSRLLVKNHEGSVTGILSIGLILRRDADPAEIAAVVKHATGI
jgi:predicted transcriptional regulator